MSTQEGQIAGSVELRLWQCRKCWRVLVYKKAKNGRTMLYCPACEKFRQRQDTREKFQSMAWHFTLPEEKLTTLRWLFQNWMGATQGSVYFGGEQ